jgi:signal transduction histidine kinase
VLARLRVGTKLMLLVVVPVCVVLAFTVRAAVADWRHASDLRAFRTATGLSFATAALADALATERLATVAQRLRPDAQTRARAASAQPSVNRARRQATARVAGWRGAVDVAGPLDAADRQLQALRRQAATGTLTVPQADDSYSLIVDNLLGVVGNLDAGRPTHASGRAADAYLAILRGIEAAERERVSLADALATPGRGRQPNADPWATLEAAEFNAFRESATGRLIDELGTLLFEPASVRVQTVRDGLATDPPAAVHRTSLQQWLSLSGIRLGTLRRLEGDAASELAATISSDLRAARASAIGELALSLVVLAIVTALGLLLRRSITRPLQEASEGARTLSRGDLSFQFGYIGRDEIGAVAAALTDLRGTAERLAAAIRSMNTAIADGRLDHRTDIGAFDGTWSRLLGGMNDTMASFARLHSREAALRRVATLVAKGVAPEAIFGAVVAETRGLLGADVARLVRYESDGTATVVAASDPGMEIPVGTRLTLEGENVASLVRRTGRAGRMETYEGALGSIATVLREQGLHSSVGAPVVVEGRAWGLIAAAWRQRKPVSSDTEGRIAQFTELVATALANADSSAQLTASRARVVAAADDARRRIERDLHDGVQQRLVSLGLELGNAEATLPGGLPELHSQLQHVVAGLNGAFEELRGISRGIHPAILSMGGLTPALKTLARRSPVHVELDLKDAVRLPERLEVAAYYIVAEALTNVAKHAQASVVHVELTAEDPTTVELAIQDDGVGGADPDRGSGLIGLADRVEAMGGTIRITSQPGAGTSLSVTLPITDDPPRPAGPSPKWVETHR